MEKMKIALAVLAVLAVGAYWYVEYVQPKQDVLLAANKCVQDKGARSSDRAVWNECFDEANQRLATPLLRVMGY